MGGDYDASEDEEEWEEGEEAQGQEGTYQGAREGAMRVAANASRSAAKRLLAMTRMSYPKKGA